MKNKPASKISSGTATIVKSKGNKVGKTPAKPKEKEISEDEALEIVSELFSSELFSGLGDVNWKTRLLSAEELLTQIQSNEAQNVPVQAVIRLLNKKPGLKDTNFQVLKARLDVLKYLAENCGFTNISADIVLSDVTEKLGDAKNGSLAGEVLTAIAEATSLSYVSLQVMDFACSHKSPKVTQEALLWLSNAIKEFGFG